MAGREKKAAEKRENIRIAVTGAVGLIGASVLERLIKRDDVEKIIVFDIQYPDVISDRIEFHNIDLTSPASISEMARVLSENRVAVFLHAAFFWDYVRDREWTHEVEVIGTLNVLNACADASVRKVIVTSTTAVYGAHYKNPALISESFPLSPQYASPWVKDKIEAEGEIRKFRDKRPEMIISVLRVCFVLGKRVNNFFIRSLLRPVVLTVMGYDPCLQFLHEEDAVEAFMLAIERDFNGEINIASADSVPLSTVIEIGRRRALPLPHFILYPLIELLWGINVMNAPASSLNFMRYPFVVDVSLANRTIGFRAKYSSLEAVRIFYEFHK